MDAKTQTTFKFDRQTEERLEALRAHYGATSKAEVVRRAIALLDRVRQMDQAGIDLAAVNRVGEPQISRLIPL